MSLSRSGELAKVLPLAIFQMININKLFPRFSIRTKLIIAFCLIGLIPVAVVWGYGAVKSSQLMGGAFEDRLRAEVATKAEEIQRFLKRVEGDVLFLSQLPSLQGLINIPPQAAVARSRLIARLGQEFLSLSRAHKAYYQIRYIDELGREIVRAEFDGQQHALVPSDRLQDKADRYYFREARVAPPGTLYVSPMDLNIEWGTVEIPHRAVVRYAVPLQNIQSQSRGIIVLNLHASQIMNQVLALKRGMGEVALASSDGFYLARSGWTRTEQGTASAVDLPFPPWLASYSERLRPSQSFTSLGMEQRLSKDLPQTVVTTILSGQPGISAESSLKGRIVAFAPIFPHPDRRGEFWVLIYGYQKAEILSSIRSLQVLVLSLGGVVLIVALGMGVAAARHITRPITELIRGAEAVAQGDFDRPIAVDTNDELEDLSRQFTRMATHLKAHERQLRELAALEERERIAGDLHDGIIQSIYATGLGLEECVRLADEAPLEVKAKVEGAIHNLNTVIRDVRNYIVGLQPEGLQEWGLSRSLADLARGLTHNSLLHAELKVEPGIDDALAPEQASHLFHICREALTNVVKHSGASRVALVLGHANGVLRLCVEDNGKGFDPAYRSAPRSPLSRGGSGTSSGQGLRNMEERARRLGASLRIEGATGRGTRITVEIPLEETT